MFFLVECQDEITLSPKLYDHPRSFVHSLLKYTRTSTYSPHLNLSIHCNSENNMSQIGQELPVRG